MGAMPSVEQGNRGRREETARRSSHHPGKRGGGSLAAILSLIRKRRVATTRLDIEREADLGRAVVSDRLATLERLVGLD